MDRGFRDAGDTEKIESLLEEAWGRAETSYKRNAADFSAQVARMKADGCDLVVLGTVTRETIGAMTEARKIGLMVDFLGAAPARLLFTPYPH